MGVMYTMYTYYITEWFMCVSINIYTYCIYTGGTVLKNLPASAGDARDVGSIPGSERSSGEGNGNPLQYSCWENPMDREAWWATVHEVSKNQTRLSD